MRLLAILAGLSAWLWAQEEGARKAPSSIPNDKISSTELSPEMGRRSVSKHELRKADISGTEVPPELGRRSGRGERIERSKVSGTPIAPELGASRERTPTTPGQEELLSPRSPAVASPPEKP